MQNIIASSEQIDTKKLTIGNPQAVLDSLKTMLLLKKDFESDIVKFIYTHFRQKYNNLNTGVTDPYDPLQKNNIPNAFSVLFNNREITNILENLEEQIYPQHQGQGLKPKKIIIPDNKNDLLDRLRVIIAAKHAGHSDVEDERKAILQRLFEKHIIDEKMYKKFSQLKLPF